MQASPPVVGCVQVESAMGPALQAAFMVVSPIGGKLLLFQSAVPSLGASYPIPPQPSQVRHTALAYYPAFPLLAEYFAYLGGVFM